MILGNFVYLLICEVTSTKINFHFYKQCSQTVTRVICKRVIFAQNASMFFSSNIPLYIKKKSPGKIISGSGTGTFKKTKFKFLHYIRHDFSFQRPRKSLITLKVGTANVLLKLNYL